jgi:hypothetical protein
MQDFADMAEAHEWTLRRLREMAGRLTEQAYLRASEAAIGDEAGEDDRDAQARWMLVFDRMARGLRLTMALEAKLSRERRWDAAETLGETLREALGERCAPRWRTSAPQASEAARDAEPPESARESDRERDDDGLPHDAPLSRRIGRLKAIIQGGVGPQAAPPPIRFEWRAPGLDRADSPPDSPPDFTPGAAADVSGGDVGGARSGDPPWRGSG